MSAGCTLIVEPNPGGHRFDVVADVAGFARTRGEVVLLTSSGARAREEFSVRLAAMHDLRVEEVYDEPIPPTAVMAQRIADFCLEHVVETVVVLDADTPLRTWWRDAARAFRGLPRRPRVVFFYTRYPSRPGRDPEYWRLRVAKGLLTVLAMSTRTLHRAGAYASRDNLSTGWIVKRVRDTAVCSRHHRDRDLLRVEAGLPEGPLVGIFGGINARKRPDLVWDAIKASGTGAGLVLAGPLGEDVRNWLTAVPSDERARIVLDEGFLANAVLDRYLAAVDVVALAMVLEGPSGIMGKALAAGVPVISAGSRTRARELAATQAGVTAEMTVDSLAAGLRRVLDPAGFPPPNRDAVPPVTSDSFAATILGTPR